MSTNQNNQNISNNASKNLQRKEVTGMKNIINFSYENKELRTQVINNEPYFCLKDVCDILEIGNPSDVVKRLDKSGVDSIEVAFERSKTRLNFINESNLYRVIFRSDKQEAKQFQDWVFNEVLPSIRKTGSYTKNTNKLEKAILIKQAMILQQELIADLEVENAQLKDELQEVKPKAEGYDILLSAKNSLTMNEVAETIGWGRNKLFEYLREKKILMENNLPYQTYCNADYFKVREFTFQHNDGKIEARTQTLVTQKGIDLILKTLNVLPCPASIELGA